MGLAATEVPALNNLTQAGLPGNLSAYGVGDTLDEALDDLSEGVRALFAAGPIPDELTREIAVVVGDAA